MFQDEPGSQHVERLPGPVESRKIPDEIGIVQRPAHLHHQCSQACTSRTPTNKSTRVLNKDFQVFLNIFVGFIEVSMRNFREAQNHNFSASVCSSPTCTLYTGRRTHILYMQRNMTATCIHVEMYRRSNSPKKINPYVRHASCLRGCASELLESPEVNHDRATVESCNHICVVPR